MKLLHRRKASTNSLRFCTLSELSRKCAIVFSCSHMPRLTNRSFYDIVISKSDSFGGVGNCSPFLADSCPAFFHSVLSRHFRRRSVSAGGWHHSIPAGRLRALSRTWSSTRCRGTRESTCGSVLRCIFLRRAAADCPRQSSRSRRSPSFRQILRRARRRGRIS